MSKGVDAEKELIKETTAYLKNHKPSKYDIQLKKEWEKITKHVCKPCWELKYCPYGPLVEQFPLLGPTREEAIEHNKFLKEQLANKGYAGWRKILFEKEVKEFNHNKYPKKHPKELIEKCCSVFGHICPVFFINEPFTETTETRSISRYIPREVMLKVVRRDNHTCQECGKNLLDNELEFHHKIPVAKGGSTNENNITLFCRDCNRKTSSKLPKNFLDKEAYSRF
ncbi:HNH endonuclease [Candidatus Woesearchaeota archaeon]|nr:HNH endonuclease [Candidatus Woesearchaeota archaeon]